MSHKIQEACQAILASLTIPSCNASKPTFQFAGPSHSSRHDWIPPPLHFPPIPSLAVQLMQLGCTLEESQETTNIFKSLVKDLQSAYERDYEKLFRRLSKHSSSTELRNLAQYIIRIIDARYSRNITFWQEATIQTASIRAQERSKQASFVNERPVFKQEWTPLLKRFFAQNAYPSHQDKVILATKTGMTVKQIYDWFQNHRNRGKRKGIPLKRSDIEESLDLSSHDSPISKFTPPAGDEAPASKKRRLATDEPLTPSSTPSASTQDFDFFCLPLGAVWPRPYSEKDVKAFWMKEEQAPDLGSFTWPRKPQPHSQSPKRKAPDSNIYEQITESFASAFHLRGSPCERISSGTRTHPEETFDTFEPWSYHHLYPKRHPAFVKYDQPTEPSKYGLPPRPMKPFPKHRRIPNSTPSSCRRTSSSSTDSTYTVSSSVSPSSSIVSPSPFAMRCSSWSSLDTLFTPESSPSPTISSQKGFEVYAGPFLGLNVLVS